LQFSVLKRLGFYALTQLYREMH